MSRIGTYGASQMYISRLLDIESRLNDEQLQVATGKKSPNYTGIATDTNRAINLENEQARADLYVKNNDFLSTRLKATDTSLTAVQKTMSDFQKRMDDFAQSTTKNQQDVEALQKWAYQAMVDMQSYLGSSVDGQYIFSGGRVSDEPVKLPANSLSQFQQMYDGSVVTYPTTRGASLANVDLTSADTGALTFNPASGTITAATDAFDTLQPGTRLTMGGLSPATNFTVQSVDAATNTIKVSRLSSETTTAATVSYTDSNGATQTLGGSLTFSPQGDTITGASLSGMPVGTVFQVSGSSSNDGSYEVVANAAGQVTIKSTKLDFVQPTTTEATATIGGVAAGAYGTLSFGSNSSGQITVSAATAGSLSALTAGSTITVAGATASADNGTYQVVANAGGTTLTLSRVTATPPTSYTVPTTANTTFSADSWYQGDTVQLQQQIDIGQTVDLGIYASDPAFEKAFRAMGLIAQGAYGTAGGLENNLQRIDQARFLITDAISRNGNGNGPFGQEQVGDLESLQSQVGVTSSIIANKQDKHKTYSAFLAGRVADIENVDKTEAVTRLLSDQTALQTSYQALASVRQLSLINYMK